MLASMTNVMTESLTLANNIVGTAVRDGMQQARLCAERPTPGNALSAFWHLSRVTSLPAHFIKVGQLSHHHPAIRRFSSVMDSVRKRVHLPLKIEVGHGVVRQPCRFLGHDAVICFERMSKPEYHTLSSLKFKGFRPVEGTEFHVLRVLRRGFKGNEQVLFQSAAYLSDRPV